MLKYKIINHRTDNGAPAWYWYLHDSDREYLCHSDKPFGTRDLALENVKKVVRIMQIFGETQLTNWYPEGMDPGLKI